MAAPLPGHMHPALQRMLVDTVQHSAFQGQDAYGKPTYATPVDRPCRIEYMVTTVSNAQGQERTSMTRIFFDGDVLITVKDKLTLQDGTSPAIQSVQSPRNPFGPATINHTEVVL